MCLAVYIASNNHLPLVDWNEQQPKFNVVALLSNEKKVRKQFNYSNVVYAGSHEGCGCGFIKDGEIGDELIQVQANYDALAKYLASLKFSGTTFEIYSCWEGSQGEKSNFREKISLNDLLAPEFEFKEKVYYEIV